MTTSVSTKHAEPTVAQKGKSLSNCPKHVLLTVSYLTVVIEGDRGFRLDNTTGGAKSVGHDYVEYFSSLYNPHPKGTTLVLTQTELS